MADFAKPTDADPDSRPPASAEAGSIPATLVIAPGQAEERSTPVYDRLVVGRECSGVDERRRLLIDDPAISRTHLELRLDLDLDQAWLTDHSTNGTRLNGRRIQRSVPVMIRAGDRVRLGQTELQLRSRRFDGVPDGSPDEVRAVETIREITVTDMVMVVGDIVGFSTIAENTGDRVLLENIDRLYAQLRPLLARHRGTLCNYVGDAFFATWEAEASPDAALEAVAFTVEAAAAMPRIAAGLALRDPRGGPLRMGWGVTAGPAAVSQLTGLPVMTVLGDTANVAFRLSGLAGRGGQPDVLVTRAVHQATAAGFAFSAPSALQVKGRTGVVEVLGASRL